ncbi:hypothetical protein HZS_4558, partial [Henneguya salminicola]
MDKDKFRINLFLCISELIQQSLHIATIVLKENNIVIVEDSKNIRITFLIIPT